MKGLFRAHILAAKITHVQNKKSTSAGPSTCTGMMCVGDNFCDAFGEVSNIFLVLTKAEKDQRGKLIVSQIRGGVINQPVNLNW
jgi:hypothetical protein